MSDPTLRPVFEGRGVVVPAGRRSPALLGVATALLLLAALLALARAASSRDPVRRAWKAVQAEGSYAFEGESAVRVGERVSRQRMRGSGTTAGEIDLHLLGGSASTSRIRIAWPEARALSAIGQAAETPVEAHALALILPLGDPLALLAVGQSADRGALEPVGDGLCRRIDFRVGGRAYGAWWLDHRDYLPVNADSGGLHTFGAEATLWQDPETGLPCRIRAKTDLPRLGGDQPGSGEVDWRYSDWGAREPG